MELKPCEVEAVARMKMSQAKDLLPPIFTDWHRFRIRLQRSLRDRVN